MFIRIEREPLECMMLNGMTKSGDEEIFKNSQKTILIQIQFIPFTKLAEKYQKYCWICQWRMKSLEALRQMGFEGHQNVENSILLG